MGTAQTEQETNQTPQQRDAQLQQGVVNSLNQRGDHVNQDEVNPQPQSTLDKLKAFGTEVVDDAGDAIKVGVAGTVGGEVNLNRGNSAREWLHDKWAMVKKKAASIRRRP